MDSLLSPWAQRISALVELSINAEEYTADVPVSHVEDTLLYFTIGTAKYLQALHQLDIKNKNPWIVSLMIYSTLGDIPNKQVYSGDIHMEARKYLRIVLDAGWSIANILQVVEWCKNAMPHYPTPRQWASVFDVPRYVIVDAQKKLVANMLDTLTATERAAWSAAVALDIPFQSWVAHLNAVSLDESLSLPEFSVDV